MPQADQAPWVSTHERSKHFRKHGDDLGRETIEEYDRSARATIRAGKRFTYQDTATREQRIGYFDEQYERLTVLDEGEVTLVTHFHCPERYVRRLPASDYRR